MRRSIASAAALLFLAGPAWAGDPDAGVLGRKWQDDDGDGQRDPAEPGLAGVTIYVDLNANGALDGGEPSTLTLADDLGTAFDESGLYVIGGLAPGTLRVRELAPPDSLQTFPRSGFHEVALQAGAVVEGLDFGNQPLVPGSVHGRKWDDRNGNGQLDPSEPGVGGVTIFADGNGNAAIDSGEPTTLTMDDDPFTDFDEAGLYWLDLDPGLHLIRELPVQGTTQTFPPRGAHAVNLPSGGGIDGLDFGNRLPEPSSRLLGLAACVALWSLRPPAARGRLPLGRTIHPGSTPRRASGGRRSAGPGGRAIAVA